MKKRLFLLASVIAVVVCGGCTSTVAQGLITESFDLGGETPHTSISIKVELPTPNQSVAFDQIRSKLIDIMDDELATEGYGDSRHRLFASFVGDRNNSEALMDYYREKKKQALERESQETFDRYEDEEWSMSYDWSLLKTYETDRFVVFVSRGFLHSNDMMHEAAIGNGPYTFDKKDGRLIMTILKPNCESEIQAILKKGLADYFSVNPRDLTGEINYTDSYYIPRPRETPQPTEDGLAFHYQQYEISSGAAGNPSFTVPYEDILPYCTPEAVKLFMGDGEDVTSELSDRVKELCQFIPDHGFKEEMVYYMTPSLYRAITEAFAAPDGAYEEIGASEWLSYFVSGQEGSPVFTVKSVLQTDPTHAIAFVDNYSDIGNGFSNFFKEHFINLTKKDGKWLMDDFDGVKLQCAEYVKEMCQQYETGEILQYLLSNEYSRKYVPDFMESVEVFYREYGNDGNSSSSSKDYSYSGSLFNNSNSYGIEMIFTESVVGIKGRYRYLSKSIDTFLPIYGVRSSDGMLHIFTENCNELFLLQTTDEGLSLYGEWYMYNDSEELRSDPELYRWKKNLHVKLQAKQ